MTAQNFDNLAFYFDIKNKSYQIKGVKIHDFSLQSEFLNENSILDASWKTKVPVSSTNSLTVSMGGEYHKSEAQNLLKSLAFNNSELECRIYLDSGLISGNFLITKYEVTAKFDSFIEFELGLISSGLIKHIIN
ncbi:hypothetical protein H1Q59_03935 [Holosporaceae bacterium 'Namur']|nr:hypothetical protein [Holosporaceae bacterium 'Namur']